MKLVANALSLILCCVSSAALAETVQTAPLDPATLNKTPQSELQRDFENIVELCTKVVRGELPYSRFDAYVEGKSVHIIGTEESRFKFSKCMSKNGYPLPPSKEF